MACRIVCLVSVSTALSVAIQAKSVVKRDLEQAESGAYELRRGVTAEGTAEWWEDLTEGPLAQEVKKHPLKAFTGALIILIVPVIAWYSLMPAPTPVMAVMSTLPRTPLSSLAHRENQVVKTRGVVAAETPGRTVNSPLMSAKCVYAHATVQLHGINGWETILELDEAKPFLLKEDDVEVVVECESEISANAPALTALKETGSFEGDMAQLPAPIQERLRALRGNKLPAHSYFRVQEAIIEEGDCIEAFGLVVRRTQKGASRCALTSGGLSASNAERMYALFPAMRVTAWREVGNRVLLVSAEKDA